MPGRNQIVEGERTLEHALAFNLLLGNTCFKKRDSHLTMYKSGNVATQIDCYSLDIMWQTTCLLINPIIVDGYASLFDCMTAVRA